MCRSRMIAICRCHSSSGMSSTPFLLKMAAPLTRMSMPPKLLARCDDRGDYLALVGDVAGHGQRARTTAFS